MKWTWALLSFVVAVGSLCAQGRRSGVDGENELPEPDRKDVEMIQKIGDQVPLDLKLYDELGNPSTLGGCVNGKPTILVMAYYRCPQLCGQVLAGVNGAICDIKKYTCGVDFNIATVSFDPKEKPKQGESLTLPLSKKRNYLAEYGRKEAEKGWHFMTADKEDIETLAKAVGFKFRYDRQLKEYDHPSGIIILTPEGKISRYFAGIKYEPKELSQSLVEAGEGKMGTLIDKLAFFNCYRYNPHTGKYSFEAMTAVKLGGLLTMMGIMVMGAFVFMNRRYGYTMIVGFVLIFAMYATSFFLPIRTIYAAYALPITVFTFFLSAIATYLYQYPEKWRGLVKRNTIDLPGPVPQGQQQ